MEVTQITESTDKTENINEVESGDKTFTQDEVNVLIESRLARAKKQMPTKDELEAFKQWKESQKTEAEKIAQREQEFHKLMLEKETIQHEIAVLKAGVNDEYADFVSFKVSKLEGKFEDNLKSFLTENPKYLNRSTVQDTGVIPMSHHKKDELGFLSIIKQRNPNFKE